MRIRLVAAAAVAALLTPALTQAQTRQLREPPKVTLFDKPIWAAAPTRADFERVRPEGAELPAALSCKVRPTGELEDCTPYPPPPPVAVLRAARELVPLFKVDMAAVPSDVELKKTRIKVVFNFARPKDGPKPLTQPHWVGAFSADQSAEVFPPKAADAGLTTGRATLSCSAGAKGEMTDCKVVEETPAEMEFGAAALRLSPMMKINLWGIDGAPAEGQEVRFALRLNHAPPAPVGAP